MPVDSKKNAARAFGEKIAADVQPAFTPPTEAQLSAFRQSIISNGFHPSVASEQLASARQFGMDKALSQYSDLQQRYPYNNGVPGTAAASSRENYFNNLNDNNPRLKYYPGGVPKYPTRMQNIPQKGVAGAANNGINLHKQPPAK